MTRGGTPRPPPQREDDDAMTTKTLLIAATMLAATAAEAQGLAGKKILFINSYHEGYEWSDGVEKGARTAAQGSGVDLRFLRLDMKRHGDDAFRKQAGEKARAEIEAYKPDVVILSDDPAVQYVLLPYYKNAKVPFVFCGVNWDAGRYGMPFQNTTGILEVSFAKQLVDTMRPYAKGDRVAYLTIDSETERIEADAYKKLVGIKFAAERFVKTQAEWKAEFQKLQGEVDMLFLGNYAGTAWNEAEAVAFVAEHSKIPTGSIYDFMAPYAMINFAKIAEEHGVWSVKAAFDIVKGASPASIPVARNKESKLVLNPKLAARAGVIFKPEVLRSAVIASR
jgi:ABC-type uncharacterized transport system substrate-binding protein